MRRERRVMQAQEKEKNARRNVLACRTAHLLKGIRHVQLFVDSIHAEALHGEEQLLLCHDGVGAHGSVHGPSHDRAPD